MSFSVLLRVDERRLGDDQSIVLRLGTDADVDQTIRSSLGHYFSYAEVLAELGLQGAGAITLSAYLLESGRSAVDFRAGPFQRAYRTTTVGSARPAGVPIWATAAGAAAAEQADENQGAGRVEAGTVIG